ncbi:MAG: CocE/NonD family hydrolase [Deltaproteobacteria bacterium]|nr:CocE/NonD family hydrolase [Deltaproteobacteria bacterium]
MRPLDSAGSRSSRYLVMRDGARIAIDVHLPARASREMVPAILHQTRYFRSVSYGPLFAKLGLGEFLDVNAAARKRFVRAGYAWVDVDARGSGASTGFRPCPWWRDEVQDGAEVARWIVEQPWSSGRIGATGVSYGGTAAEMLLGNRHPAVVAAMPRFSLFDVYTDVAFPGGIHLEWFTRQWARFNQALDRNRFDQAFGRVGRINLAALADKLDDDGNPALAGFARRVGRRVAPRVMSMLLRSGSNGVSPVTDDARGEVLAEALREHQWSFDVHRGALGLTYRDDTGIHPLAPEATIDAFSPHHYLDDIRGSGAVVCSYSGWLDGAYQHSAIKRHLNLPRDRSRLVIGPWDHGGRNGISPGASTKEPGIDHEAEMLAFFDPLLRGAAPAHEGNVAPGDAAPPVRYFTMVEERWKTADAWPPPGIANRSLFLDRDGALGWERPERASETAYRVDPDCGTGARSRWRSLVGIAVPLGYGDRARSDERSVVWTTAPLPADAEVTGHPIVHLFVTCDAPDATFFAYLEDVAPDGRVTYVTEGQLRAIHRRLSSGPAPYATVVPHRTFARRDGLPLVPSEVAEIVFDLLPTSYLFRRGHAIRLALAGADRDHFARLSGPPPRWIVHGGGARESRLSLPVRV